MSAVFSRATAQRLRKFRLETKTGMGTIHAVYKQILLHKHTTITSKLTMHRILLFLIFIACGEAVLLQLRSCQPRFVEPMEHDFVTISSNATKSVIEVNYSVCPWGVVTATGDVTMSLFIAKDPGSIRDTHNTLLHTHQLCSSPFNTSSCAIQLNTQPNCITGNYTIPNPNSMEYTFAFSNIVSFFVNQTHHMSYCVYQQ